MKKIISAPYPNLKKTIQRELWEFPNDEQLKFFAGELIKLGIKDNDDALSQFVIKYKKNNPEQ